MAELPWKPVIYLPANLTARLDAEVLQAEDLTPWCENTAAGLLGPGAKRRHVRRLAANLTSYAGTLKSLTGRGLPAAAAVFFWPDFNTPRANAEVYIVADDHAGGPVTMARARELTGPDKDSLGETEAAEAEVPAGPAFRARRHRRLWGALPRFNVMEEVSWFIWPAGSNATVIITVSWRERMFSKAGATIADDMARNFRVEPRA
jgi:hypothetical protein